MAAARIAGNVAVALIFSLLGGVAIAAAPDEPWLSGLVRAQAGGAPITDGYVLVAPSLFRTNQGPLDPTLPQRRAELDGAGRFAFDGEPLAAFHDLLIVAPGFAFQPCNRLPADSKTFGASLPRAPVAIGTVVDRDGRAIAGARIRRTLRWRNFAVELDEVCGPDGAFALRDAAIVEQLWSQPEAGFPGFRPVVTLEVAAPGFATCRSDLLDLLMRLPQPHDATTFRLPIVLGRGECVAGRVVDAATGEPIAGATLSLRVPRDAFAATSGSDGRYALEGLVLSDESFGGGAVGTLPYRELEALAPGYAQARIAVASAGEGAAQEVDVALARAVPAEPEPVPTRSVELRVVDSHGRPYVAQELHLAGVDSKRSPAATTDASGRARLNLTDPQVAGFAEGRAWIRVHVLDGQHFHFGPYRSFEEFAAVGTLVMPDEWRASWHATDGERQPVDCHVEFYDGSLPIDALRTSVAFNDRDARNPWLIAWDHVEATPPVRRSDGDVVLPHRPVHAVATRAWSDETLVVESLVPGRPIAFVFEEPLRHPPIPCESMGGNPGPSWFSWFEARVVSAADGEPVARLAVLDLEGEEFRYAPHTGCIGRGPAVTVRSLEPGLFLACVEVDSERWEERGMIDAPLVALAPGFAPASVAVQVSFGRPPSRHEIVLTPARTLFARHAGDRRIDRVGVPPSFEGSSLRLERSDDLLLVATSELGAFHDVPAGSYRLVGQRERWRGSSGDHDDPWERATRFVAGGAPIVVDGTLRHQEVVIDPQPAALLTLHLAPGVDRAAASWRLVAADGATVASGPTLPIDGWSRAFAFGSYVVEIAWSDGRRSALPVEIDRDRKVVLAPP